MNSYSFILCSLLVGYVGYKSLSKYSDIEFKKQDKLLYDNEIELIASELVDKIINDVVKELEEQDNLSEDSFCKVIED